MPTLDGWRRAEAGGGGALEADFRLGYLLLTICMPNIRGKKVALNRANVNIEVIFIYHPFFRRVLNGCDAVCMLRIHPHMTSTINGSTHIYSIDACHRTKRTTHPHAQCMAKLGAISEESSKPRTADC